jgi:hypothetical protein
MGKVQAGPILALTGGPAPGRANKKGVVNLMVQQYLLASDFDQTLSFNDSGVVLAELIGVHGFHDKVRGLAQINLVQQGAELSYLILHDPEFRRVRSHHLVEAGKQIRLKHDVALFAKTLETLAESNRHSKELFRRKTYTEQSSTMIRAMEKFRLSSAPPQVGEK